MLAAGSTGCSACARFRQAAEVPSGGHAKIGMHAVPQLAKPRRHMLTVQAMSAAAGAHREAHQNHRAWSCTAHLDSENQLHICNLLLERL
jgi:hypothetical protein